MVFISQGITIECKKPFGQFLVTNQPYCIINGEQKKPLKWKERVSVPLQPNKTYQISVKYPYIGEECGVVNFKISVKEGEIKHLLYNAPKVVSSPGKIEKKGIERKTEKGRKTKEVQKRKKETQKGTKEREKKRQKFCKYCGAQIEVDANFCKHCGKEI